MALKKSWPAWPIITSFLYGFIYCWTCSCPKYSWNTVRRIWSNNKSINYLCASIKKMISVQGGLCRNFECGTWCNLYWRRRIIGWFFSNLFFVCANWKFKIYGRSWTKDQIWKVIQIYSPLKSLNNWKHDWNVPCGWMREWLLFNDKWTIFQLYYEKLGISTLY